MMSNSLLSKFSFIIILLSLLFFVLPALVGNSFIVAFFIISFVLLIIALIVSIISLTNKEGNFSGLSLFSVIVSIIFLLFLIIGALLQV